MNTAYALRDNDLLTHAQPGQYVLRVRDMADSDKPREKLAAAGPASLTMAELLAIVWGTGTKKEEVMTMASRTLKDYGEKSLGAEVNAVKLAEVADIPVSKASQLIASLEIGRRFYASQQGRPMSVRTAKQAYSYMKEIGHSPKEQLRGLYLNSRYQVIHDQVISIGTLTGSLIHPREVFQPAIERGAIAIILAHNHPSGILEPTQSDIDVTSQLVAAGKVLGIDVLDHLVITPGKFVSLMSCL